VRQVKTLPDGGAGPWRRVPLQPTPFLDETFGSWLRRCASTYRMTVHDYVLAIIKAGTRINSRAMLDFDTSPPVELLRALAAASGLAPAELEYLVVPATPWALRPTERDACCSMCLCEDLGAGTAYVRRAWLDAWTLVCLKHGCPMAEYRVLDEQAKSRPPQSPAISLHRASSRPGSPSIIAIPIILPSVLEATDSGVVTGRLGVADWLDPNMLHSVAGRDLVMFCGSCSSDYLYKRLFGFSRRRDQVWHDSDGNVLELSDVHHPRGTVRLRIHAAYLASLIWLLLCPRDNGAPVNREKLVCAIREGLILGDGRRVISQHKVRWERQFRERWDLQFGN
jgi:hypothetical protein